MSAPDVLDASGAFTHAALDARIGAERHTLRGSGAPAALILLEADQRLDDPTFAALVDRLRERHRCWPYRLSGHTLAIPLAAGSAHAAADLAEIARAAVTLRPVGGVRLTASVGAAASDQDHGWDDPQLADRARAALLTARTLGGNAAVVWGAGLVTPPEERRRLLAPQRDVVAPRRRWWSLVRPRPEASLPPVADTATVGADLDLVDTPTAALSARALAWHAAEQRARRAVNGTPVAVVAVAGLDEAGARRAADTLRETAPILAPVFSAAPDALLVVLAGQDVRHAPALAARLGDAAGWAQAVADEGTDLDALRVRAQARAVAPDSAGGQLRLVRAA